MMGMTFSMDHGLAAAADATLQLLGIDDGPGDQSFNDESNPRSDGSLWAAENLDGLISVDTDSPILGSHFSESLTAGESAIGGAISAESARLTETAMGSSASAPAAGIASSYGLTSSALATATGSPAGLPGAISGLLSDMSWSAQIGMNPSRQMVAELAGLEGPGSLGFATDDGAVSTDIGTVLFGQYAAIGLEPISGALADTLTNHTGTLQQTYPQLISPPSHVVGVN